MTSGTTHWFSRVAVVVVAAAEVVAVVAALSSPRSGKRRL